MNTVKGISILLVEDEDFDVSRVRKTIELFSERLQIAEVVSNGRVALELIEKKVDGFDVVILDYQISGGLRGEELIRKMKESDPFIQIIVITKMTINVSDYEFANNLLNAGAFWYCTKYPGNIEEYIHQPTDFLLSIFNAYEKKKLEKQKLKADRRLMQSMESLLESKRLIGESRPMILADQVLERDVVNLDEATRGQVLPLRDMGREFRMRYFKHVRGISSSDSNAAEKLGLAPSNFYRMCKELGIK